MIDIAQSSISITRSFDNRDGELASWPIYVMESTQDPNKATDQRGNSNPGQKETYQGLKSRFGKLEGRVIDQYRTRRRFRSLGES